MGNHLASFVLYVTTPTAHSPGCFQSPLGRCNPGQRTEGPGLAMGRFWFKSKLSSRLHASGQQPQHLWVSVSPICRRRREDWIIRLWRPWVPHQHHSVNGTWEVPPTTSAAWPHFWLCLIRQVAPFGPQSPQPSAMKRSPSMEAGCPGVLSQKGQEVLGVQGYAQ